MGRMTVDEYMATVDERRTQLVDGEVVVTDPDVLHQHVVTEILAALRSWTRAAEGRGQHSLNIDVRIDGDNCYSPDVLWYSESRAPGLTRVRPQPIPDLAVEVRSPSTWRYDIGVKKTRYEEQGLQELWLVDTDARVTLVYRRSTKDAPAFDVALEVTDRLTTPLLPGFALDVAELFA